MKKRIYGILVAVALMAPTTVYADFGVREVENSSETTESEIIESESESETESEVIEPESEITEQKSEIVEPESEVAESESESTESESAESESTETESAEVEPTEINSISAVGEPDGDITVQVSDGVKEVKIGDGEWKSASDDFTLQSDSDVTVSAKFSDGEILSVDVKINKE